MAAVASPTARDMPVSAPETISAAEHAIRQPLTIHSVGWMPKAGMKMNPAASEPVTEPSVLIA